MGPGRVVTSRAQGTDEQLALAVQTGDRAAEAELVRRYTAIAYTIARPYATLRSDSDDMRQESLIAISKAARTYRADGGASFRTLAKLAIQRQLWTVIVTDNRMGRKAAESPLSINASIDLDGHNEMTLEGTIADPFAVDPPDGAARSEQLQTLVRVVRDDLSPMERAALVSFLNGDSLTDIYEQIGRTSISRHPDGRQRPKTAENALDRARRKLRVALEEPRPLGVAA